VHGITLPVFRPLLLLLSKFITIIRTEPVATAKDSSQIASLSIANRIGVSNAPIMNRSYHVERRAGRYRPVLITQFRLRAALMAFRCQSRLLF